MFAVSPNSNNEAPPPPERGSSYAVMSQQSALRSNNSTMVGSTSMVGNNQSMTKRVSFHDPNANTEPSTRINNSNSNMMGSSITMDSIREDPNVSLYVFIFKM